MRVTAVPVARELFKARIHNHLEGGKYESGDRTTAETGWMISRPTSYSQCFQVVLWLGMVIGLLFSFCVLDILRTSMPRPNISP